MENLTKSQLIDKIETLLDWDQEDKAQPLIEHFEKTYNEKY